MATAVSGAGNTQQALGLDLGQPAGAGAPIFSVGAARVLAASGNTGNAVLNLTVSDASKVQASDYAMSFDGSNYLLTRSSDHSAVAGSPFTPAQLATGVQFDGVTLKLTGGTPAVNDRFVLQPVALAAASMQMVMGGTKGLAAAAPFTGSMGVANTGTATLASLTAIDPAYNGALSATITFTSDTGNYAWTLSDGSSGTGVWIAGTPIGLNGFALNLAGVPKTGDTVDVKPTTAVASSNGNAIALANLASRGIVASAGGSNGGAQTITDAYASAIADVGVRVQSGKSASAISTAVANQAEKARADKSGVNLEEEAEKMIQ
jgi:flagellar hook-associated protein 1 FlgK